MITETDLNEAILEYQGKRNPTTPDCIKLASFLTLRREMFGEPEQPEPPSYSYATGPAEKVTYDSGTEFSDAIMDRDSSDWLPVIDELMSVLSTINPRLYNGVMRRLER